MGTLSKLQLGRESFLKVIMKLQQIFKLYIPYIVLIFIETFIVLPPSILDFHYLKELFFGYWGYGWDGMHYIKIAIEGYSFPLQAFFPLYPLIIKYVNYLVPLSIAQRINLLLLPLTLVAMIKLLTKINVEVTTKSLLLFLAFPTTFFLQANYTETLFILLSTCVLYMLLNNKYLYAVFFALLLSAVKVTGISMAIVIVCSYLYSRYDVISKVVNHYLFSVNKSKVIYKSFFFKLEKLRAFKLGDKSVFPCRKEICETNKILKPELLINLSNIFFYSIVASLGALLYFWYLHVNFGSYLIFFEAQGEWQRHLIFNQGSFDFLKNIVYPIIKAITTLDISIYRRLSELLAVLLAIFMLVKTYKILDFRVWFFCLLMLIIPVSSGSLLSFNRHILTCFPLIFYLGTYLEQKKHLYISTLCVFSLLQMLGIYFFLTNVFVG